MKIEHEADDCKLLQYKRQLYLGKPPFPQIHFPGGGGGDGGGGSADDQ